MEGKPSLEELNRKLAQLALRQDQFQKEILDLKSMLAEFRKDEVIADAPILVQEPALPPEPVVPLILPPVNVPPFEIKESAQPVAAAASVAAKKEKTSWEEFIGTNLLNKIGIAVVVIGVGIGAEYAIDQGLISPVMRIVLGYLCGVALIGVAIRLKANYENFSAVLLSGGMAVLYFITFAAYDLYELFPQLIAFALMVLFTGFTVFAALQYNIQVIAIIGFVGAYGVPFLLSDGSGRVVALFSYMCIINAGVLVLGFRKFWKTLYYLAFGFTWLIVLAWDLDKYNSSDLWILLGFSTAFFILFYATVLAYKLIRGESLTKMDITLILLNSFIYFGLGYFAIESQPDGPLYLGMFTVFNAILHFIVCFIIFRNQGQSRDIFLFAAGMVLVFLTLAVPVQLEGNWVTIVWAGEAALLFWIGRTKNFPGYEKLSYPLIFLAIGSLLQDWSNFYGHYYFTLETSRHIVPFLNVQLLTSLLACAAVGWIVKTSRDGRYPSPLRQGYIGNDLLMKILPVVGILLLYGSFHAEVNLYWTQRFAESQLTVHRYGSGELIADYDVLKFRTIWLINYSAIFVILLGAINLIKLRDEAVGYGVAGAATLVLFILLTVGLSDAAALRASYLHQTDATYYFREGAHLLIRYVCIALAGGLLWINYKTTRERINNPDLVKAERIIFHLAILSILSSELVSGLALLGVLNSDKLALSILWGCYALGLIVLGLRKDLKYIRISAIVLFGVTLIKLFLYDIRDMGTIAKTLVLIILGVLILVASFLYNKFKKKNDEQK